MIQIMFLEDNNIVSNYKEANRFKIMSVIPDLSISQELIVEIAVERLSEIYKDIMKKIELPCGTENYYPGIIDAYTSFIHLHHVILPLT